MNNLELLVVAWCRLGWLLLLVFTASVLVVAALRKPSRHGFGAERAVLLWLLPPSAMLATLLPHAASHANRLPPIVTAVASIPGAVSPLGASGGTGDWQSWACVLWLVGVVATLSLTAYAQWHYRARLRGATRYDAPSGLSVVRAVDPRTGPALVGVWRPRIVLPADFDNRYDDTERVLILAHEAMHARRLDGCWSLLAQLVTAVFWFHPLAWWALATLRRDQELACDAAVLRESRGNRRSYANALLKTQPGALPLPVGCAWSSRHPLTERIAMLKQAQPSAVRRVAGVVSIVTAILLGAGVAYAATAPAATSKASNSVVYAKEYQLKIRIEFVDGNEAHREARRVAVTMCQAPDKAVRVSSKVWAMEAVVTPLQGGRVRIGTSIFDASGHEVAKPVLIGALGDPVRVAATATDGTSHYTIDITPLAGCPARKVTSHKPA